MMSVYARTTLPELKLCFKSLELQTFKEFEVFCALDGPVDFEVTDFLESSRFSFSLKTFKLEKNVGLASALNEMLPFVESEFCARVDTDDVNFHDRFEVQVNFMKHNVLGLCGGHLLEFRHNDDLDFDDGKLAVRARYRRRRTVPISHLAIVKHFPVRSPFNHPTVMFRTRCLREVGGYPSLFPEDYFLWLRFVNSDIKFANLDRDLVAMRFDRDTFKRRDKKFLLGELEILKESYRLGYISFASFSFLYLVRISLRKFAVFSRIYYLVSRRL